MSSILAQKNLLLLLTVAILPACNSPKPAVTNSTGGQPDKGVNASTDEPVTFVDASHRLSMKPTFSNGEESDQFTYLEAMGGGVGVLDYDKDGWPDLFFPRGGKLPEQGRTVPLPGTLLRNCGASQFREISESANVDSASYYSQGAAVGDINNDGFPDLLVTGFGGLDLFVNQGDGTFAEMASSVGLNDPYWSTSAGFGDFDADGTLDLYVAHYVDWSWDKHPKCNSPIAKIRDICPPAAFNGQPDCLFLNRADGTFARHDADVGLLPEGKGLGVLCADLNQDGKLDVYVANDTNNNFLYLNRGDANFQEVGVDSGAALDNNGVANGSMGVVAFDYDGNLTPDLWVCNYEDETFALYKNDGEANYRFVSSSAGITALGTLFVAFGTIAADLDRDGDEDLVVANGHVLRYPGRDNVAQQPLLLTNNGKSKFSRQKFPDQHYFSNNWRGRGVAQWDFDLDGDVDLVFSNINQPAAILENQSITNGQWCNLELVGQASNRDAVGSQVTFRTLVDGNKKQYARWVNGGGSFMSQSTYRVHWGCTKNEMLDEIEVKWPSGKTQVLKSPLTNQLLVVIEDLKSTEN